MSSEIPAPARETSGRPAPRIIALWGPARSISTAVLKAFGQRQDTTVCHEPFNDCYYYSRGRMTTMYGDREDRYDYDGNAARAAIAAGTTEIVFFKDMAYFALPYIDDAFLAEITNSFIIRDPRAALRSRKSLRSDPIGEWEYGYTALGVMWRKVTHGLRRPSIILEGDRLRNEPGRILEAYCDALDVPFDPAMLSWPPGDLRPWQAHEELVHRRWHRTLEASSGFIPSPRPTVDYDFSVTEWEMVRQAMEVYEDMLPHAIR
jgi:hypothetical protein